jgi:hypothetical protein
MGILDEAIREHLELKRAHGADDSELKQLEDDAFGPPQRPGTADAPPDLASEAATEFMAQPDLAGADAPAGEESPSPQEPEPPKASPAPRREPVAEVQEAPQPEADDGPAEEEQPAAEHETVAPPPASHSTEERHAIADQPTEMFDVEQEFAPAPDAADPSDEELAAEEIAEPRLAPAEPLEALTPDEPEGEVEVRAAAEDDDDDEDDFFDEQRLSDELDQALEAPLEPDSEEAPRPASEELESEETEREGDEEGAHEAPQGDSSEGDSDEIEPPAPRNSDEDVLEETPDFLEEAPEDDQLWFEQKPPKDFDFDD